MYDNSNTEIWTKDQYDAHKEEIQNSEDYLFWLEHGKYKE